MENERRLCFGISPCPYTDKCLYLLWSSYCHGQGYTSTKRMPDHNGVDQVELFDKRKSRIGLSYLVVTTFQCVTIAVPGAIIKSESIFCSQSIRYRKPIFDRSRGSVDKEDIWSTPNLIISDPAPLAINIFLRLLGRRIHHYPLVDSLQIMAGKDGCHVNIILKVQGLLRLRCFGLIFRYESALHCFESRQYFFQR